MKIVQLYIFISKFKINLNIKKEKLKRIANIKQYTNFIQKRIIFFLFRKSDKIVNEISPSSYFFFSAIPHWRSWTSSIFATITGIRRRVPTGNRSHGRRCDVHLGSNRCRCRYVCYTPLCSSSFLLVNGTLVRVTFFFFFLRDEITFVTWT